VLDSLGDDRKARLLTVAFQSASDAVDDHTARVLGRAYARGVIQEDQAVVDEQARIVKTIASLNPIDVKVLDKMKSAPRWLARPVESLPNMANIAEQVPGAANIVDSVIARLSNLGLIADEVFGGSIGTVRAGHGG
jgi:hypothetical protein